ALINASSQVVWTNTPDGKMLGEQPGWSALTGQTEAEYSGYGWADAVHSEDAQPTIDAWDESVRTRTPFEFEHRVRRYDGVWRLFSIRGVPILEESGEIREWVGTHTDITEEREAEQEQIRTLAQLSAVLESATDGIVVADMSGDILMMNPAGLALHEFSSNDQARRHLREYSDTFSLFTQNGDKIPPERLPLSRVLDGETFTEYECRVRRTDTGTEWWASYSGSPARDERGEIKLVILTVRDVSERKQMEAQRDGLLRRIEEAADRQRKFLREMLSSMSEGRLRLCESVSDLPIPITPQPAYEPVTLDRMTIRVLRRQTGAACNEASLPPDRESDLLTAVGEAAMNAVVHAGGGTGSVYLDVERGIVQVWVRDTGAGINEDSLHRATLEKGFTTAGTLGHGFWMMLKTADHVYLLTGANGTTVVVEQERHSPVPSWMQSYVDAS
ncbi:MAG: PAS domain S-box protein, partial [Fibrella sp.]|nr:PAS domain S-box protein [Armatimonadota bacterium]